MASQQISVLVVDIHALFRAGIRALFDRQELMQVVADCASAEVARELAERERPEVILLELNLGSGARDGLDALPVLLEASPDSAVLVVTAERDGALHQAAMLQGARGVVTKDKPAEVLLKAVERVHAGEVWFDRAGMGTLLKGVHAAATARPGPERLLTQRERQIIELICEGLDNRRIGTRLNLSAKTVRNHLSSIFDKLGVPDRLGLAIHAFRQGLVDLQTGPSKQA